MFRSPPVTLTEPARACSRGSKAAFTLVEVLVSMTILLMMLLIMTQVIGTTQKTWHAASSRLTQFREARTAFDTITRGLTQATLNPFRDFTYEGSTILGSPPKTAPTAAPTGYATSADLGFRIGAASKIFAGFGAPNMMPGHAVVFQAPLGNTITEINRPLNSLLCVSGYFVLFGTDLNYLPMGLVGRLQPRSRYRLYQYQPTTESNPVYNDVATQKRDAWVAIDSATATPDIRPVAENIVALILAPSFPGAAGGALVPLGRSPPGMVYDFNSYVDVAHKNQLPSSVQVAMVAMDEESAARVEQKYGTSAPTLFGATFVNADNLDADLREVRAALEKLRLNFRIFSSTVFIPAADK